MGPPEQRAGRAPHRPSQTVWPGLRRGSNLGRHLWLQVPPPSWACQPWFPRPHSCVPGCGVRTACWVPAWPEALSSPRPMR